MLNDMKILVVDDSAINRQALQSILAEAGYLHILTVTSPFEAFNMLGFENPEDDIKVDLILMDIMMPGIDGIEACSLIKNHPHLEDIPVIMITSQKELTLLDAAYKAGAADYIVKPVQKVELLARVRSALALKKEMDKRKAREQELLELTRKLEDAYEQLKKQSSLDGLTEIANRRHFDEYLDVEWKRAQRDQMPLSIIMADLDVFKLYNDNYGHQAGDECLRKVAAKMQSVLKRPADLVARYGGEEFAVVLPETELTGATGVGEKLRSAVENLSIPHAYSNVSKYVTISLGVATAFPAPGSSSEELVNKADQALYRAKQSGRNRVYVCENSPKSKETGVRNQESE